jgi:Flp pilus assembly protein TadB
VIAEAREIDPDGDYRLSQSVDFSGLQSRSFDLILSMFPFDNIAGSGVKLGLFRGHRVSGHPFTAALFVAGCRLVVLNTIFKYPANTALGLAILALGMPVYAFWARHSGRASL